MESRAFRNKRCRETASLHDYVDGARSATLTMENLFHEFRQGDAVVKLEFDNGAAIAIGWPAVDYGHIPRGYFILTPPLCGM